MIIDLPKSPQPPFQGGVRPICPAYDTFGRDTAREVAVLPLEKLRGVGFFQRARQMMKYFPFGAMITGYTKTVNHKPKGVIKCLATINNERTQNWAYYS